MTDISVRQHGPVGDSVSTIFVASADRLKAWNARVYPSGQLIAFNDTDLARAVDAVLRHQPKVVVVERSVLAETPGQEFVRRLQLDQRLPELEVRSITDDRIDAVIASRDAASRAEELVERMEDLTGRVFGPYRIVAPLEEGGMASVYKAYQPGVFDRRATPRGGMPRRSNAAGLSPRAANGSAALLW